MTLSIIIVTWNSSKDIVACLSGLASLPKDWEIIVVDNSSQDSTVDVIRERFPFVRVIPNNENLGFSRANNQAIAQAAGDNILLLNPDTEVTTEAIQTALRELSGLPKAGLLALQLRNTDGSLQPSCFRFPSPSRAFVRAIGLYFFLLRARRQDYLLDSWDHSSARTVDWVLGAFMLVPRAVIEKVGGLPEEYEIFTEDIEWCHRIWAAGYEVWFSPNGKLIHHGNRSGGQLPSLWRAERTHRGKYQFCLAHYGRAATRFIQLCDLLGYSLRRLRYSMSPEKPGHRFTRDLMALGQQSVWRTMWNRAR